MYIFLFFLFLFTVITLVGHGIWVFLAFLVRGPAKQQKRAAPKPGSRPKNTNNPVEDRRMSLFWAIHHIKTLANEKKVDWDAAEKVISALCAEQSGVPGEKTPPPAATNTPSPAPTVPSPRVPPHSTPSPETPRSPPPSPAAPPREPPPLPSPAKGTPPAAAARSERIPEESYRAAFEAPSPPQNQPPPPSPPFPPARAAFPPSPKRWQDIFTAFLEENNIRWGECVGGLLILFCSGALVVSFWTRITELWFLQVGLFTGIAALLFGAGLYANRKWHLPNTSMGLLSIATLLTPITFLLISTFGRDRELLAFQSLLAEGLSLGILGWLLAKAAPILMPAFPRALTFSVLALSGFQFPLRRFNLAEFGTLPLLIVCSIPLLLHAAAIGWVLRRSRPPGEQDPSALLWFWGFTAFPTLLLVVLCGALAGDPADLGQRFSALICLYGGPSLFMGLHFQHHRKTIASEWIAASGTFVGVLGLAIMGGGLLLAWPMPATLLPALLVICLCCVWLALREKLPEAWVPACLTAAFGVTLLRLISLRVGLGWQASETELLAALFSGHAARALVPAAWGLAAFGLFLRRHPKCMPLHGRLVLWTAAGMACACILMLGVFGFARNGDPLRLQFHYALFGLLGLVAPLVRWLPDSPAPRLQSAFVRTGLILLTLAILQGGWFVRGWEATAPLLLIANLSVAGLLATWALGGKFWKIYQMELQTLFWISSLAAFGFVLQLSLMPDQPSQFAPLLGLVLPWMLLAALNANDVPWILSQIALALATTLFLHESGMAPPGYSPAAGIVLTALFWAVVRACVCAFVRPASVLERPNGEFMLSGPSPAHQPFRRLLQNATRLLIAPRIFADQILLVLAAAGLFGWFWHGFALRLTHGTPFWIAPVDVSPPPLVEWMLYAGVGLVLCLSRIRPPAFQQNLLPRLTLWWVVAAMPLLAGHGVHTQSVSALMRWSAVLLVWGSAPLSRPIQRQGLWTGTALLSLFSLHGVSVALAGRPFPAPGVFAFLGPASAATDLALPLAFLGLSFFRMARRETQGGAMLLSSLFGHLTVLVFFLVYPRPPHVSPILFGIQLLQAHTLWGAFFGLVWLFQGPAPLPQRKWLHVHLAVTLCLLLTLLAPPPVRVFFTVIETLPHGTAIANGWSLLAAVLTFVCLALTMGCEPRKNIRPKWTRVKLSALAGGFIWLVILLIPPHFAARSTLLAYRFLVVATGLAVLAGSGILGALHVNVCRPLLMPSDREDSGTAHWLHCSMLFLFLLSIRATLPPHLAANHADLWVSLPMAFLALVFFAHAFLNLHPRIGVAFAPLHLNAALAGVCLHLSAFLLWHLRWMPDLPATQQLTSLLLVQCLATLPNTLLTATLRAKQPELRLHLHWAALGNLLFAIAVGARLSMPGENAELETLFHIALAVTLLLNLLVLRDERAGLALHRLFLLPWAAVALHLESRFPGWQSTLRILCLIHGILTLFWGLLWATQHRWTPRVRRLGFHARPDAPRESLYRFTLFVGIPQIAYVLFNSLAGMFDPTHAPDLSTRLMLVSTLLLLSSGLGFMAKTPRLGTNKSTLDSVHGTIGFSAVAVFACVVLALAWSCVNPRGNHAHPAQYSAVASFSLVFVSLLYAALQHQKPFQAWSAPLRAGIGILVPLAALALLVTLLIQGVYGFVFRTYALLPPLSVFGVAASLVFACFSCIRWALRPERDPFRLSHSRRHQHIYAAEGLLALLVLHLRLSFPELFSGFILSIWPLIVMGLAFLGLGLSAAWTRKGLHVLAVPVSRSALFLPLLPLIGFWVGPMPLHESLIMLLMGGVYGIAAIQRRSFAFSVLAALCANSALWILLHRTAERGFLDHPQLWTIPFALCVLLVGHLHRRQLGPERHAQLRYTCVSLIYISSTAEMFIQGVAAAPHLPLALMGLSVAGILAGMMFRVQSFLFCGLGFLLLSLITILYHASANLGWTWIWYVAGIVLGLGILFLFAVFESKREFLLHRLETLKSWER